MRKTLWIAALLFLACFLLPASSFAQNFTVVSATVVDPAGLPYAFASVQVQLIPTGVTPTLNGLAVSAFARATADATGTFSITLASNAVLLPGGTQWQFTVNESPGIAPPAGTGPQTIVATITISGASQSISATLNALAPKLANGGGLSGAGAPPGGAGQCTAGTIYTNTLNGNLYSCFGTTWVIVSGAGVTCAGFNAINAGIKDTSCLAGADAGARMNTCNSTLGANGGICNTCNDTGVSSFFTAVIISNPITVVACGSWGVGAATPLTFNYTGAGNFIGGGGLAGSPDQAFVINKSTNGTAIRVSGTNITISDVQIVGNGNIGRTGPLIDATGSTNLVLDKVTGTNLDSVALQTTSAAGNLQINRTSFTNPGIGSSAGVILVGGSATISNSNITIQSGTGNAVSVSGTGTLTVTDSTIVAGGTSGIGLNCSGCGSLSLKGSSFSGTTDALVATGATLNATGNSFGGGATECVLLGSNSTQFIGNTINWSPASGAGRSGIHLKGDTIGNLISKNIIKVNGGETPSGNNYGIWLDTSAGGHFLSHQISENYITGANNAFDVGIFFDNSTPLASSGPIVSNNACVDMPTLKCILRSDVTNVTGGTYFNNRANAVAATYALAGSTLDIILDFSVTFANLPNAGDGSRGICTDCTSTTPPTAGGGGVQLVHIKGQWAPAGVGPICVNVTPVTTAGGAVTTDQNLLSCPIPAGILNSLNRNLRIHLKVVYTTAAANASTITIKARLCTVSAACAAAVVTLLNITSSANPGGVTNNPILLDGVATVQTAGAAAAFEASGDLVIDLGAAVTSAATSFPDTNTATIGGVDTTAAQFLQTSIAFSIANAANTGTGRQLLAWLE